MSGIVGYIRLDGAPAERLALGRALTALRHRGVDGRTSWVDGHVGLAHAALHTAPEARFERMPLLHAPSGCVLTADARLDNRAELLRAFDLCSPDAAPTTDAELLLHAYLRWGLEAPHHLVGAFAFALWDPRQGRLFAARDHTGIRPLYYHASGRLVAFGSEIKALHALGDVPRRIDEVRIGDYLDDLLEDPRRTFYEDIFRLPPAHRLVAEPGRPLRIDRYWAPNPASHLTLGSDAEYVEAFRSVWDEAVGVRLRSTTPVGATLSGGLDSSSVACTARDMLAASGRGPLHTFSAVFPSLSTEQQRSANDERPFIEAVLAQGGVVPHRLHLDQHDPLAPLDEALRAYDQPFFQRNVYLGWAINAEAARRGLRVVLDGLDGDNVVSYGLSYLAECAHHGRWGEFARLADQFASHMHHPQPGLVFEQLGAPALADVARVGGWGAAWRSTRTAARHFDPDPVALFWRAVVRPTLPEPLRQIWHRLKGYRPPPVDSMVAPALAARLDLAGRREALTARSEPVAFTEREAHYLSLTSGANGLIMEQTNLRAAAHGVEARHPFMDPRVQQFCLSMPSERKIRGGRPRAVLRDAMAGRLPEAVRLRMDKGTLAPNFRRNLWGMSGRAEIETLFRAERDRLAPYVDLEGLRRACDRQDASAVWTVLSLARWLRQQEAPPTYEPFREAPPSEAPRPPNAEALPRAAVLVHH